MIGWPKTDLCSPGGKWVKSEKWECTTTTTVKGIPEYIRWWPGGIGKLYAVQVDTWWSTTCMTKGWSGLLSNVDKAQCYDHVPNILCHSQWSILISSAMTLPSFQPNALFSCRVRRTLYPILTAESLIACMLSCVILLSEWIAEERSDNPVCASDCCS